MELHLMKYKSSVMFLQLCWGYSCRDVPVLCWLEAPPRHPLLLGQGGVVGGEAGLAILDTVQYSTVQYSTVQYSTV